MIEVLVGGVIALASGWLLDGGIKRRTRRTIREEIELADLLGDGPRAEQLRAMAERRLERYSTSFWSRFRAQSRRLRWAAVIVFALGVVVFAVFASTQDLGNSSDSSLGKDPLGTAVVVGLLIAWTWVILEHGLLGLIERSARVMEMLMDPLIRVVIRAMKPGHRYSSKALNRVMYGSRGRRESSWAGDPVEERE